MILRPAHRLCLALAPVLLAAGPASAASAAAGAPANAARVRAGASASLAILETTDLHANVVGYDYFKLAADPSLGLDRAATLIEQARREFPNTLLFDNGDTLQGTALGDYEATPGTLACGQSPAIYRAMHKLGYDGASVGNHDFDFGLPYLGRVTGNRIEAPGVQPERCAGPGFPVVLANVVSLATHQPIFAPYKIIEKRVQAVGPGGKPLTATLKVGIIGFTTPTIAAWDKRWLDGKVTTEGVVETAKRYVPEMRAKGADLIVAISHGGLDASPYAPTMENGNYYLAQVPGIDALLLGHAHLLFPDPAARSPQFDLPNVDKVKGTVFGVPAVMANLWGKNIGVIQMRLRYDGRHWQVERERTVVETRATQQLDKSFVAPDEGVDALVRPAHEATIRYVQTPVGSTDFRMASYFADVGDPSATQVVNQAQTAYVKEYVKANLAQYADLPVLSMAAAFKAGGAGLQDYTDVAPGPLALNNAADLYLYPNTVSAVKIDGAGLKAWLEKAAARFNTIDPARREPQELVNAAFATYNFDTVTDPDFHYEIDVTRPAGGRIRNMSWQGKPVGAEQLFLVATNNYRASGGGGFPGLGSDKTVVAAPDTNREVLIGYVKATRQLTRTGNGGARSWRFAQLKTAGPVVFHAPPGKLELARAAGLDNVSQLTESDGQGKGFALYAVDLSK
ncbi:bifunctional 2',3'-cyclic-nucleotide 2'-phosphodiesterase/3'-nucleotidase [Massilia sp. 9096]|uniref:bifunctional 2',3'-cyclic-nucleotide 2'-phosphodiesterase/3'-nucleotidase n=1 Tax=Massilia sp. 9096 TaxID=1500894 RepID=UPI000560DCEC|nr:bifunctional 2',3'-cyclic-nucleotide 2'-phosphodiesterase/3'-nucleotidase [Massilia sp. 9096]